jgi:hypothetical protein
MAETLSQNMPETGTYLALVGFGCAPHDVERISHG